MLHMYVNGFILNKPSFYLKILA